MGYAPPRRLSWPGWLNGTRSSSGTRHRGVCLMCTAVRIVIAAAEAERRLALRRAAVTAEWEVVGEADGPEAAYAEAVERRARFLVLDASAAGPRPEVLVRRL